LIRLKIIIWKGCGIYDAYGNNTIFDAFAAELAASAIGNRYMFQGREYDEATKL
tara:strand:+ start:1574 stop:1735 length:162 start_codon:yes stop_codon:yes gene_type:complete